GRGAVIERAGHEVAVVGAHADLQQHVRDRLEAGLAPRAVRALRLAGRAAGVDDDAAAIAAARARRDVGRRGRERAIPVLGVGRAGRGVSTDDDYRSALAAGLRARLAHRADEVRVHDRRGRLRVIEDVRDL